MTKSDYVKNLEEYGDNCRDCGGKNDPYMVQDDLWKKVAGDGVGSKFIRDKDLNIMKKVEGTGNFMCLQCFEKRLGRDLTVNDFTGAPINFEAFGFNCKVYCSLPKNSQKDNSRE